MAGEIDNELYIAQLLRSGILQKAAPKCPKVYTWDIILAECKKHSIANTVYPAVLKLYESKEDQTLSKELMNKWAEIYHKAIRKEICFNAERANLLAEMEKKQIRYLPLKGIVIKGYYPGLGMRSFADNDILFDSSKTNDLKQIMNSLGFFTKSTGKGNHDIYMKQPNINIEMHRTLLPSNSPFYGYGEKVWERAKKQDGTAYGYQMTKEDFYLFFIFHAYKHYSHGGTGLRTLSDEFLLIKKDGDELDWNYVNQELSKYHVLEFEQKLRILSDLLFQTNQESLHWNHELMDLYLDILGCGVYGTKKRCDQNRFLEQRRVSKSSTMTKLRFFIRRAIPGMDFFRLYYPVVGKYPILYPFAIIYRFGKGIVKHKKITSEVKTVMNYHDDGKEK